MDPVEPAALEARKADEEKAEHNIAEVAEGTTKVLEPAKGLGALEVEVAEVLVAGGVVLGVGVENHLDGGDGVVDADDEEAVQVHVRLLVD